MEDVHTEEVVGLTGDIDAGALDESERGKLVREIQDIVEVDGDDVDIQGDNDWESVCSVVEEDTGALIRRDSCECCPAAVLTE